MCNSAYFFYSLSVCVSISLCLSMSPSHSASAPWVALNIREKLYLRKEAKRSTCPGICRLESWQEGALSNALQISGVASVVEQKPWEPCGRHCL